MKRFIALVLSLVMALSLCAPAWATDGVEQAQTDGVITTQEEFDDAVAKGGEITLGAGTFKLPSVQGKDITLIGAGTDTVVDYSAMGGYQEVSGSSFVFKNMTVKCAETGYPYPGLQHTTSVSYEKCHIMGTVNLFCPATFKGCTFDSGSAEHNVVTYGSDSVTFEGCEFTYADRSVNCYAEDASSRDVKVTFTGCEFTKIAGKDSTGAIETNSMYTNSLTLTINNCTVNEGDLWWVSTYDQLKGAKTTVTVDGALAGAVATADGKPFKTLQAAVEAVKDGGEIKLLDNVTFDENTRMSGGGSWYEGLYYTGDKSFTVDLNGKTITNDSSVNDYLLLFKNDGSKANIITFKNGTIEAASSAYAAICTSTTSTQKITINLESVNLINNNSNGAAAKIRGGAEMNVKNGTVITGKNSYVGIEAVNKGTVVNIYDGAEIYQKGTSSYVGSLVGVSGSATINVYGGYGESAKGAFIAMTSGGTINVSGGEWIANTDGTPKNDNYGVLIAQNDKATYLDAGNSVINVTGGAFKGGYNCYGNAVGDAQINISGGYFNADPSAYCVDDKTGVASDKAGYLYMVGEKKATAAEVKPADPEITVDTSKMETDEADAAQAIAGTGGVTFDDGALNAVAKDVANENKTTVTEAHVDELKDMADNSTITEDDVVIVVQPYFDVAVNDVEIVEDSTTGDVTSASIELDITPMYQKVATTEDVANDDATEIKTEGNDKNAVAIGDPQKMTITEPVEITVQIPEAMAGLAIDKNGDKILYVTHVTDAGVSYVYEAKVTEDNGVYFATFTNPHGFSTFIISAVDDTVATVNGVDNYTNLQDAIDNMGKDATIVVKKSGLSAVVKGEVTFKVVTEAGVTDPTITAGVGYTLTKKNLDGGGVEYTVTKITYPGGYYPYNPAPSTKPIQSADTFDAGIALYVGMSVIGAVGTVALGKKRED